MKTLATICFALLLSNIPAAFSQIDLTTEYSIDKSKDYLQAVKQFGNSSLKSEQDYAFFILQKMIKRKIDNNEWESLNIFLEALKSDFDNNTKHKIERIQNVINKKSSYKLIPLSNLNSDADEYKPTPSIDGKHLYFTAQNRHENIGNEDIYVASLNEHGQWLAPKILEGSINTYSSESIQSISTDNSNIIIMANYESSLGKSDIYRIEKSKNGSWDKKTHFPTPINSKYNELGAVLSSDGNKLIFVSDRPNGVGPYVPKGEKEYFGTYLGNTDIYISFLKNGIWSEPVNLGKKINTPFCEYTPYLHPDGKTLYFSSNGHPGLGGLDIFMTTRLDDTWQNWSEPVNLGKTLNTTTDDWGFKVSTLDNIGYVAKLTETNQFDLFSMQLPDFAKPAKIKEVKGIVIDEKGNPLAATIDYLCNEKNDNGSIHTDPAFGTFFLPFLQGHTYDIEIKKEGFSSINKTIDLRMSSKNKLLKIVLHKIESIASREISLNGLVRTKKGNPQKAVVRVIDLKTKKTVKNLLTDSKGKFNTSLKPGIKYGFDAEVDGFISESTNLDCSVAPLPDEYNIEILLLPESQFIKGKSALSLNNIFFESGTTTILIESFAELDKIGELISKHPVQNLLITGHTDSVGTAAFNQKLSEDRAKAIANHIFRIIESPPKIKTQGMGENKPIADNGTPQGRQLNRRVEIQITLP